MSGHAPALGSFVVRTLLWMPPCLAAWYFSAPYHALLTGTLARLLLNGFKPGQVSELEFSGADLAFVTSLEVHPAPGQTAVLVPEVNSLLYTYGMAFFLALMLATRPRWWKIPAGVLILLPFQSWGIAFDFLSQIGVKLGADVAGQAGLLGWRSEVIALGYQMGSLIFPTLIPVVLWGLFCRAFIESLLRRASVDVCSPSDTA